MTKFYVNVYELDRSYGGPEEGGWWYDSGELVDSQRVYTEAWGKVVAGRLLDGKYARKNHRGNVNYRGGDYDVRVEPHPGSDWSDYERWE